MHYYALAIVPAEGDLDELLAETMAPFDENAEDHDDAAVPFSWDWYQVGGRYTGRLSGADPQRDPRNWERCFLCEGTGLRNDALGREARERDPQYGCNECSGDREITGRPGVAVKWPTQWVNDEGDVQDALSVAARLAELPDEALPYTIVTHASESVTVRKRWTGDTFEDTGADFRATLGTILSARMAAGLKDRVVVVDYHC
jgi:hypothetical protein